MVKGDDKLERLRSAPARAPCSRTPIPQHSESQHESEVSTAPRSCIPAFAHRPAVSALLTLAGSRTTASPSQSLLQGNPLTRPRTAKEPVPLTFSVAHSRGALTPTVFLLTLWDFSVTHTGSPLHSLPRSFLFHTQSPSHLGSCTLTNPSRVSLSHSHTHARTRARSLAGCACVFLTPPSTQGSTLPASSSQPRRLSRALRPTRFPARIQHAATAAK